MFSRRYLRRSLFVGLFLLIILLFIFFVYQNRYVLFFEKSLHDHDEHNHFPNYNIRYQFHSTRSIIIPRRNTTIPNVSTTKERIIVTNSTITTTPNHVDNEQLLQDLLKAVQKPTPSPYQNITLPVIETKNLHRFVHLDLKGAAPKVSYYEQLFPFLKQYGANGLLIEYEDMFPFTDHLAIVKHQLAYTKEDIARILQLAEINQLTVMPLLQVYGHLEYVLKLKEFIHLREDRRYPQVITPCLEASYKLLFDMIDQMLSLHPSISYLHIGCDEVYYRLIHPKCVDLHFRDDADLFIRHVTRIAKYIKLKRPQIKLFIWHDMLSQLVNYGYNNITELSELVVPMVWAYVDDIKIWFDQYFWTKMAIFPEVWVASSYKGSSGEITTMSYIGHHQRNQQTWLEAMYIASEQYKVNFTGIAVTGWSRYDHMLSLCELLPSSIPSLTYALQTIIHGRLNRTLNRTIAELILGCNQIPLWERSIYPTFISCSFPGHELYEIMLYHDNVMREYEDTMSFVRLYITDVHIRQNYIHYKRGEECLDRLIVLEDQMIRFIDNFQNITHLFFTDDIAFEWLQTYFLRPFKEVQQRLSFIDRALTTQSFWSQRPLPMNTSRIVVKKRIITSKKS